MHDVHLPALDMNLIVALDALLTEGNVTRAAARIGISQSAMSHALARLRALTGDPLLIRVHGAMSPTLRATALGPPLRRALADVQRALAPPQPFVPATARKTFTVGTSDYGEFVLLPKLVARLAREAPGVDIRVHTLGDDLVAPLASGAIDLVIAPVRAQDASSAIVARPLFVEDFVCVVRKGHPLAKKRLTVARYAAASHVLISPRETLGGFMDDALAALGRSRRIAVMVPHFLVAPRLIAETDMILTLARRVADDLAKPLGLTVLDPPVELSTQRFTISALWHERAHHDAAQRWFCALLAEVAKSI